MGFHLAARVYEEISCTTATEQAILAYLAFRADDRTGRCFPSRASIAAATHLGHTGVSNGLNGLKKKNILQWLRGGRKAGSRGSALANDYRIAFLEQSIARDATTALTSTRLMHWPPRGQCSGRDEATIRMDQKEHHPSVISARRTTDPTEDVDNRAKIEALGRAYQAEHQPPDLKKKENISLAQMAMDVCGVSDWDNSRVFQVVLLHKDPQSCLDEILTLQSEVRQGEHKKARNLAAILVSRLKRLPDRV